MLRHDLGKERGGWCAPLLFLIPPFLHDDTIWNEPESIVESSLELQYLMETMISSNF